MTGTITIGSEWVEQDGVRRLGLWTGSAGDADTGWLPCG